MTVYVFDIDGTICTNTFGEYDKAIPFQERIDGINYLYNKGQTIKMFTARGSTTQKDWTDLTKKQLKHWGVKYHELIMGKPYGDFFIDDKAHNDFFWKWKYEYKDFDSSLLEVKNHFKQAAISHNHLYQDNNTLQTIQNVSKEASNTLKRGGKLFFAGNGGSFSDAQHLVAEFICKLNYDRNPLPAVALGTNSSSTSAIGNDYGFEFIFSRELEAIGSPKDLIFALSTSGESKNIINLLKKARELNIKSVLLTGPKKISEASKFANTIINTPDICVSTAEIQQLHITIGHYICNIAQSEFI